MKNPFKVYRIDVVMFLGFAGMIVLLFSAVILLTLNKSTDEITDKVSHYQQRLLTEMNKKMTTNLIGIERTAITASRNFGVLYDRLYEGDDYDRNRISTEIRSQLSNFVYSTPMLQSIHIYSDYPFHTDIQEAVHFYPMNQISEETWYEDIKHSDSAWIGEHTVITNKGDTPVISFALKAYDSKLKYFALVIMNVKVTNFHSFISPSGENTSITLIDGTGKQITQVGASISDKLDIVELIRQTNSLHGSAKQGSDFIVWSTSSDSRWTLVEATPWEQLTEGTIKLASMFIILGISAIVLALFIVIFLSRQFTKPISLLLRAMYSFSINQKAVDLPEDYRNEFGMLFHGYHKLVNRVEELYRSSEENHKRQIAAEIRSLQMMINPHFLYNTLDQINWTAIEAGQTKISRMLSHIASMFRMSLSNLNTLVTVDEEIQHIEHYLKFQSIRWESALSYSIHVEEAAKTCFMPKFTLQPFIENAFVHGFHGRRSAIIHVRIFTSKQDLMIEIEDNGKGLISAEKKTKTSGGHGLQNVRERIEALFGKTYTFALVNKPNQTGVIAQIMLPIIQKDGE